VLTPSKKSSEKILSAQGISSRSFNQQEHIKNESYSSEQPFPQFTIKDSD